MAARPPFLSFTLAPVTVRDRTGEVGLVADEQDVASAGRQVERVEVAAREAFVEARPRRRAARRRARPSRRARTFGLEQAGVELDAEALQRARRRARACLSPFAGQLALGVVLPRGAVLGLAVSQQPDHVVALAFGFMCSPEIPQRPCSDTPVTTRLHLPRLA